ncbi:hypothetical protein ABGB12_00460 [Actinocorallia sp. B10E7]|uniref:hypothetical protein n=1 Tax=Actinocorallia sp. B10E7 TaxID=3153558 RepID=UPI00325D9773
MRGSAVAWLGHPVSLAAVIVLAVNDQVLKEAFPGPVTGKISDFAGLVFAPALLALGISMLGWYGDRAARGAIVATGAGFVLVKTTAVGARIAGELWSLAAGPSLIRADPTDLLALPALVVSWKVHRRVRERDVSARWMRFGRTALLVPFAVVATAATSAPLERSVLTVEISGERIVAWTNWEMGVSTADGGATWQKIENNWVKRDAKDRACVPSEPLHCYRVVKGRLAVQETTDGRTWRTAWEISQGRTDFLRRQAGDNGYDSDISSRALVVQQQPGGHVVVVANGGDGLTMRDTSGTWHRLGFPTWTERETGIAEPAAQWEAPALKDGSAYRFRAGFTVLIVLALTLLAGLEPRARLHWGSLLTLGGAVAGLTLHSMDLLAVLIAPLSALLTLAGLTLLFVEVFTAADPRRPLRVVPLALISALLSPVPLLSWTAGALDDFRIAALGAVLIGAAGVIATLFAGRAPARRA